MQEWCGRAWVVQVIAVSSKTTAIIGRSELDWPSLVEAIRLVASSRAIRAEFGSRMVRYEVSNIG